MVDQVVPDDDRFHPVASDDWYWSETGWWELWVPQRRLSATLYTIFRPRMGIVASSVHVWDDTSSVPWEALYSRSSWHLPIPDGADPTNYELANGLRCVRREPLRRWTFSYDDPGRLTFELDVEGVHAPHPLGGPWFSGTGMGHYEQPTHVTGTIELWGERIPVDCFAIRDRSWHVRSELGLHGSPSGYTHCTRSATDAFHAIARSPDGSADVQPVFAGYLLRDGVMADVVAGERRVLRRRGGHVERVRIELTDADGRTLGAEGDWANRYAFFGSASILSWQGLVEWHFDDGSTGWGEDQDNHAPATDWLALARQAPDHP